jgi:flagellar hook-associated protein 2
MATGAIGGSTLDVQSLVSQLVAAEAAPQQRILQARELKYNTTISALGALKGALSGFQNALEPLRAAGMYDARSASSADTDIFTATADATAAAGNYEIEVLDLASAHQLRSGPFLGGTSTIIGTGTLTIGSGDTSFSVEVDANNNTLAGIAAAINNSETNRGGVQATIIKGTDGARLVLSASKSGVDSAITVSQTGGDGGLQSLVYDPNGTMNLTQTQPASNARISIAGVEATSNTNVFSDVVEGVTISVKAKPETPGETTQLTVARNASATTDAVKKFVTAYNAMQAEVAKQRSFDPNTKAAGALFGDTMLRGIESQVRDALNNPIEGAGTFNTLASLGIKTNAAGKLELDEAKLKIAMDADPSVVNKAFGGDNGMAQRMYDLMKTKLANGAEIESRSTSMTDGLKMLDKQKTAIETRLTVLQARLLKQYTALDSLLSSMQSTSAYLSQQLANLPGVAK